MDEAHPLSGGTGRTAHVVVVSDRAASGVRPDRTAPRLEAALLRHGFTLSSGPASIVPDDRARIGEVLRGLVTAGVRLVLTTGGTGPSPRDVTPEATRDVVDREYPGFGEVMRAESLKVTIHAAGSRALAGSKGGTLIVNLPGSPNGAVECFTAVAGAAAHVIDLLAGGAGNCAPSGG